MSERSVNHATFVVERTYPASPARVFSAFADPEIKRRWFAGPEDWSQDEVEMDFRVGGREVNRGGPKGGPISSFESQYLEIIPDERIIFAYDMHLDDIRLSFSLTTIELHPEGSGTRLTLTEQGAFLDGHEDPSLREEGTRQIMDALGRALELEPASV